MLPEVALLVLGHLAHLSLAAKPSYDRISGLCELKLASTVAVDQVVYTFGGSATWAVSDNSTWNYTTYTNDYPDNPYRIPASNADLRVLDLSKKLNLNDTDAIHAQTFLPANRQDGFVGLWAGNMFWHDEKLFYYGGTLARFPPYDFDKGNYTNWGEARQYANGDVYVFNSSTGSALDATEGHIPGRDIPNNKGPISYAGYTQDPTTSRGYTLGGTLRFDPFDNGITGAITVQAQDTVLIGDLVGYKLDQPVGLNVTTDVKKPDFGRLKKGNLLHVPAVGTNSSLIWVGGELEGDLKDPAEIMIYDIGNATWYIQKADFNSQEMNSFKWACAVAVTGQDRNSHFIYVWGGTNAEDDDPDKHTYNTVWVLAIPSFQWIGPFEGHRDGGIEKGTCVLPGGQDSRYMVSYGGITWENDNKCDFSHGLRVFDLNTLEWADEYDPEIASQPFVMPSKIGEVVNATQTPSADLEPGLEKLFPPMQFDDSSSGNRNMIIFTTVLSVCAALGIFGGGLYWFKKRQIAKRGGASEGDARRKKTWRQELDTQGVMMKQYSNVSNGSSASSRFELGVPEPAANELWTAQYGRKDSVRIAELGTERNSSANFNADVGTEEGVGDHEYYSPVGEEQVKK